MNPRRLTPSMSWLIAFEAAAKHLSFTRAAEELSLTQSVVSRHVQSLEALLEVRLFVRDGRQLRLSEAGAMYLREVRSGLQQIRNASRQVSAYRASGGSINLACLPTFAAMWLMPRLSDFYARHPDTLVHIHARIRPFDMELAGMDAVISGGDSVWPGLVTYPLIQDQLVPVISPALLAKVPLQCPADATAHTLLQVATRPDDWSQWFSAHDIPTATMRPGPQFEMTSHLIQAAVAGIGIALVPSCLVEEERHNGSLLIPFQSPANATLNYDYRLYVTPHRELPSTVVAFKAWLLGMANDSGHRRSF
ncbi:LysR substrate-binding domain-containing protein [Marinobacter sp. X15-166B]|uniref:LysR substrate-binding domain-containing protein n=1 Tax=Marinobacter sp. X15-166B TaxID=1897620 RepID=UPI00085BE086|nr:LysR substrate-binding domain-containing protein [Marinobacter sp. X15-166B]OEY66392.1 LysR family transcriptional regulator [Marinobacter sp. X15-166B]